MKFRRLLFFPTLALLAGALALTFPGCSSLSKKKQSKANGADIADQNSDASFQSFLGRLRKAVEKRDAKTLATMMSADFGYSWAPGGEGPGVFDYWDRSNIWPELSVIFHEKFVPNGNFMVAPKQVVDDPEYKGFRAGLRMINGSWRFCYFVPAPPAASSAPTTLSQ